MSRYAWPAFIAALAIFAAVLLLRGCDREPTKVERDAQTQVDSAPIWREQAKDSQAVLDTLSAKIEQVRADSARVAGQIRALRQRKDSLARVTAEAQQLLHSIPPLEPSATASDSSAHWSAVATNVGHIVLNMAEEIAACRQGDEVYEGRVADLEDALGQCQRRAVILEGQRNTAQIQRDRSVGLLDQMLEDKRHADDWNLPFGIRFPGWVKCAALGLVATAVGTQVDRNEPWRGGLIGGGSASVGCLVS